MAKIIGIDLGTVKHEDHMGFYGQVFYYNPAGGKAEFASLEDAYTNEPGEHILTPSYLKSITTFEFEKHFTANPNKLICSREVSDSEFCNSGSKGYLTGRKKKLFFDNVNLIDTGNIDSNIIYIGKENDYRSVKLGQCNTRRTVFTKDYHEAANALHCNVPFVFLIPSELSKKPNLKLYIFKKLKNMIDAKKRNWS